MSDAGLLVEILADEATWVVPRPGLEDAVVRAVMGATRVAGEDVVARGAARRRRTRVFSAVAAAAAVAAAVVTAVLLTIGGTGPDYAGQLAPTALAPGARASVEIAHTDAGFRIRLDAHGLARLQPGEYYQAWLKNRAGALVPIGTFSSSAGPVTLWSGVSPRRYPAVSVTIEAADGDQTSSGRRVLVGDVHPG